ncbi:hypothetical protein [Kutzneria chonburiensis]|uniref:DUF3168 domain-containing protein n=1 Tax=Kutzneria chonburiensis TaxID=1483604 RepID=A0ABV6N4G9_9PSEU|nr:hypothetical protein [Kutzneria chonburiensis]
MFADVEAVVVRYLSALDIGRVTTRTPANLADVLPLVMVNRVPGGGGDDGITDVAQLDVDTFTARDPSAPGRGAAHDLAEQVRAAMLALRHKAVGGVLVDTVETLTAPCWVDYADDRLNRFVATYELSLRAPLF